MKKVFLLALCSFWVTHAHATQLSIGDETAYMGESGNQFSFSVAHGSATAIRSESAVFLLLNDVLISGQDIHFRGGDKATHLQIILTGQNLIDGGRIEYEWGGGLNNGMLSIHGPGSLSMVSPVPASQPSLYVVGGDLWIGEGAVLSIVHQSTDGTSAVRVLDRNLFRGYGDISIVNSALCILHGGIPANSIEAYGGIEAFGSIIAVCSPEIGGCALSADSISFSHSSVTIVGAGSGLNTSGEIVIDTSCLGVMSGAAMANFMYGEPYAIRAGSFLAKNTIGFIVSGGSAISASRQEYHSGNNLTVIGSADSSYDSYGTEAALKSSSSIKHFGGKTTLFAPHGSGISAPSDFEISGGTLSISSAPDWQNARKFFTASSIASTAETVLQGAVSGNVTLSLLENFFADELFAGAAGLLTQQISSAKPFRGIYAETVNFKGGKTDVTCQTDANGIVYSKSATVSGGTVTVNGKPWAPTVTISFNANGGTVSPKSRKVAIGALVGTLPRPKRAGYAFAGWFTAKSGGAAVSPAAKISKSTTLYAHWAKPSYRISFQPNGGKGTMKAQKLKYGKAARLRKNAFRRNGCVFLGWAKTPKGALAYKNAQAVKNLTAKGRTVKLYAKWGRKVSVGFHPNGGAGAIRSKTRVAGRRIGKLPTPTRKKWTFDGWWTRPTGGKRVTASTVVKKAMTVYAHWTPVVTLRLNANGGKIPKKNLKCKTYLSNGAYYLDTRWTYQHAYTPTRATYHLNDWYTKKTGGTVLWKVKASKPCTLKMYAQWSPNYFDICFYSNDDASGHDNPYACKEFREGAKLGPLPTPSRAGYKFGGWWSQPDGRGIRITASTMANDSLPTEAYAHWIATTRTVAFYSNGELVDEIEYNLGEPLHYLPTPTNGDRWDTFDYWYVADTGKAVGEGTVFDGSFDTLEASWHIGSPPLSPTVG